MGTLQGRNGDLTRTSWGHEDVMGTLQGPIGDLIGTSGCRIPALKMVTSEQKKILYLVLTCAAARLSGFPGLSGEECGLGWVDPITPDQ